MAVKQLLTDPSENVKALVEVNERWRDVVRELDNTRQNDLRNAETVRIDQLAAQKQAFDFKISELTRINQEISAQVLAIQVKEVKADLQVDLRRLNQFMYESSGKGLGVSSLAGWVVAAITLIIAAAAYLK